MNASVTFNNIAFLKLGTVKVPEDVGGDDWKCEDQYGKRTPICLVKIDGQKPVDALPEFPVEVPQPLALAPPGFVGDPL